MICKRTGFNCAMHAQHRGGTREEAGVRGPFAVHGLQFCSISTRPCASKPRYRTCCGALGRTRPFGCHGRFEQRLRQTAGVAGGGGGARVRRRGMHFHRGLALKPEEWRTWCCSMCPRPARLHQQQLHTCSPATPKPQLQHTCLLLPRGTACNASGSRALTCAPLPRPGPLPTPLSTAGRPTPP